METQPITQRDINRGQIRIPITGDTKSVFPRETGVVEVVFLGEPVEIRYDPRLGPDRERSGVLHVGKEGSSPSRLASVCQSRSTVSGES